jgi:hypothetical protein
VLIPLAKVSIIHPEAPKASGFKGYVERFVAHSINSAEELLPFGIFASSPLLSGQFGAAVLARLSLDNVTPVLRHKLAKTGIDTFNVNLHPQNNIQEFLTWGMRSPDVVVYKSPVVEFMRRISADIVSIAEGFTPLLLMPDLPIIANMGIGHGSYATASGLREHLWHKFAPKQVAQVVGDAVTQATASVTQAVTA